MRFLFPALMACTILGACATLPEAQLSPARGLTEVYRDRQAQLFHDKSFDRAAVTGLTLGDVRLDTQSEVKATETAALNSIRAALQAGLRQAARDTGGTTGALPLRLDVTIENVRLVDPVVNVLSSAALIIPLDRGAMTLTTRYVDTTGRTVVLRRDRISGKGFGLRSAFSKNRRLRDAAQNWGRACGVWPGCSLPPAQVPEG
ncbi:hypothetical protein ACRARG_12880 [Pseudooceanicola sp. C21-150M6]|uniref:hypothetical protein n=1 Tax=Pseudooceanicola sp. C21-150M6 TaxID=3434355 RepID=UPI003D7F856F